jgi:Na+:H+ antiporter, NhaA family
MSSHDPLRPMLRPDQTPPIDLLLAPFRRFFAMSSAGGILVLGLALVSVVIANTPWHEAFQHLLHTELGLTLAGAHASTSVAHLINDGLMAVFFLLVGLEIKRELLIGELREPRKAALPAIAALGGMVVPASIYAVWNAGTPTAAGWGIPMATDIAFALGILRLAGRVPPVLLVFLAALAIIDDLGAVIVIALFYTSSLSLTALGWALAAYLGLVALNRSGVRHPIPYILLGLGLWLGVLNSGVHATIAGVLLATTIPLRGAVPPEAAVRWATGIGSHANGGDGDALERMHDGLARGRSPLVAWEHALNPWVSIVIIPVFALANAGITLDRAMLDALTDPVFWGVAAGLVVGKPIGVVGSCLIAVRLGWAVLPTGVDLRGLLGVGVLAGVGFTMAIFIAGLAFESTDPRHLAIAKAGILAASLVAGVAGWVLCRRQAR